MVTDDGFIGIFKKEIIDVLKILNTIFATGITFGVGSEFVSSLFFRDKRLNFITLPTM